MRRGGDADRLAFVRATALVQGLALVTFPTLSAIFTDPKSFALSQSTYGSLFLPQSIVAIVLSLACGRITARLGVKSVLLCALGADIVSMGLLASSVRMMGRPSLAYGTLLVATACLGFGFALVAPTLNVLSSAIATDGADREVLITNSLLGAAAALAPLILLVFVGLHVWWGLPLVTCLAFAVLFLACRALSFGTIETHAASAKPLPPRFWLFAAFGLAYGICEQMNGSWAPIYFTLHLGAAAAYGSIALTLFWALNAAARVGSALLAKRLAPSIVFRVLPFLMAAAFVVLASLPVGAHPLLAVGAFALAGLGASALLPLVISFAERSMPEDATSVTSSVFAVYLIGYGLAAYGAGPLQTHGLDLARLYGASAILALVVAALASAIVRLVGSPRELART